MGSELGNEADAGAEAAPARSARIGRLLQDSSLYLLGNIAIRAVGFLAIPFYSRFLNPAQYGLIELVELSTQTIAIAFGLQAIGTALSRLFHDQKTLESEQAVVSTSLIATAVLSALVTVVAVAGARPLSLLVFHDDTWATLLQAAFIAMFFSNMIEVVLVYERIRDNARFFVAYTLVTLFATLALNIVFIGVLGAGVWGFVSSKLVVTTTASVYLGFRMKRDVGWRWRGMFVPELVRFGAPLVLSSLSYFAIHFSDRFFLSSAVSLAELGRYALAYKFAILVSALVGDSFGKSWNVTLYRYVDQADWRGQFARVAAYFTYILFATGLAIALFGPELLHIMVPPDYFPPPLLLPIIIASYIAREIGDFFRALMLINKRSGLVGKVAAGGAVLNLALNVLLIPAYGIYGAAASTFLTWFIYMIVCWGLSNAEHKLPVRVPAYLRITALTLAVYLVATATRVPILIVQALLDGLWTLVFCGAAAAIFFSADERRGLVSLGGSIARWLVRRGAEPGARLPGPDCPRLLMVAYAFPAMAGSDDGPDGPARSLAGSLARCLQRGGTEVMVLTSTAYASATAGKAEAGPALVSTGAARQNRATDGVTWAVRSGAFTLGAIDRLLPSGGPLGWLPVACAAASRRLTAETIVFSSQGAAVSHLVALTLKHRHGLRWVADLREPAGGRIGPGGRRAAWLSAGVERLALDGADAVIVSTEAAARRLRARSPSSAANVHIVDDTTPASGRDVTPASGREAQQVARVIEEVRAAARRPGEASILA